MSSSGDPLRYTFSFSTITNADELVSISAGSISTGEGAGGAVTMYVENSDTTLTQIIGAGLSAYSTYNFANMSPVYFSQTDIIGLVFAFSGQGTITIPNDVVVTFDQVVTPPSSPVPEPVSLALLGTGAVGLGLARRRKSRLG